MKRFWDAASVAAGNGFWSVLLDGSPVRVPGGGHLRLRSLALAEAVAEEWRAAGGAKGGELSYADLPLTRLAGTAQERIAPDPAPVVLELARYGGSDLLCYRAEQPAELVRRQQEFWQPWLDWAGDDLGARLRVTSGIVHVPQDPAALAALAGIVSVQSAETLAGLSILVPSFGSLVLGLAVAMLRMGAAEAQMVASVDEHFQAEIWGEDEEAASRRAAIAADVAVAGRFMLLSRIRGADAAPGEGGNGA
jgi:chaperone required for assembly of F1-ATPase